MSEPTDKIREMCEALDGEALGGLKLFRLTYTVPILVIAENEDQAWEQAQEEDYIGEEVMNWSGIDQPEPEIEEITSRAQLNEEFLESYPYTPDDDAIVGNEWMAKTWAERAEWLSENKPITAGELAQAGQQSLLDGMGG